MFRRMWGVVCVVAALATCVGARPAESARVAMSLRVEVARVAPTPTTAVPVVPTTAAAPAAAAVPAAASVPRDPQAMLDAAVARLPGGLWAFLTAHGWTISVAVARRGYVAGTWRDEKRSAVFVRPSMTPDDVVGAVAHEVGHMVDFQCFGDAERNAILAARGAQIGWWPSAGRDDRHWGLGDWAETFAFTVTGRWDGLWPAPSPALARELAAAHGCSY